ncbi:MAG: hypothetical protein H0X24_24535 [Ktedonobacterales bacterium]|nr:hypothetical protein [Ktedonobacterales bacterium]
MTQVFERSSGVAEGAGLSLEERQRVIAAVERVRACQLPTAAVDAARKDEAETALREALEMLRPHMDVYPSLERCLCDMDEWLAAGLDTVPNMHHLVSQGLELAPEGVEDIMFTNTTTLNYSDHPSLEFVLYRRFEGAPAAALRSLYHCRYLIIAYLIDATAGFGMESNCIVCFTECVPGGENAPDVMDVFFTSKNALRGKVILQPLMEEILAPNVFAELRAATLDDLRLIVPCKTVTHEWSHRQGVIPLTEYRELFNNFIGAGLEEARVELNGARILYMHAEQGGPHAAIYQMAAQFILADRLLRYPFAAHPRDNADAVSGQYILGQFIDKGLLTCNAGGVSIANRTNLLAGLERIMGEIEQTQYLALMSSSTEAHRVVREHVGRYSRAVGDDNTMDKSLFYKWMEHKLRGRVPVSMDWKAAFEEYGE